MEIVIKNHIVIIDDEDYTRVNDHSWYLEKSRSKRYFRSRINGKLIRLHTFLIGPINSKEVIDHINGNTLDNRKENLRVCSRGQNIQRGFVAKNKYLGVTYYAISNKYRAALGQKHIGYFLIEKEAAIAYNKAAIKAYGEFAKLNEVEE